MKFFTWQLRLLGSNEQLLMIYETSSNEYEVYELNFLKMEWVKMQNFGDQALFLGHIKGSGCCNVTTWKGSRQPSNCIYVVRYQTFVYTLHFLDGRYPELIMHSHCMPNVFLPFWYFPRFLQCGFCIWWLVRISSFSSSNTLSIKTINWIWL